MPLANNAEREHSNEVITIGPDTLVLIDLDRTLINSNRLVDVTLLSLEDSFDADQDSDVIEAIEYVRAQERRERGNSFAYLEALQQEIGSDDQAWVDGLATRVVDANRNSDGDIKASFINQIMLPGALDLLRKIESLGVDWATMTAGQPRTQQYKLSIVRQILAELGSDPSRLSYLITDPDHPDRKADMINKSFINDGDRGQFDAVALSGYSTEALLASHVASRRYSQVVLLDDKLLNLESSGDSNPQLVTELVKANADPKQPGRLLGDIADSFQLAA